MQLHKLVMKNFRCFDQKILQFNAKRVIIVGPNGSGKTSIIEAFYFLCFFKSFRTSLAQDLVNHHDLLENENQHFFISLTSTDQYDTEYEISVGYHNKKKQILVNKKKPSSRRNVFLQFPIFSITEDDLQLIKGDPEYRRTFIDQAITYQNPEFLKKLRTLKNSLSQRNALLSLLNKKRKENLGSINLSDPSELHKSLESWTHLAWQGSIEVEGARVAFISLIETLVNKLLSKHFASSGLNVTITYQEKRHYNYKTFEEFWSAYQCMLPAEVALERTMFGAHLDDIIISLKSKKAKSFASRGQQKLVVFLIKFSQYLHIKEHCKQKGILLLDDFITDFDQENLKKTFDIIKEEGLQTFITCPNPPQNHFPQYEDQQIIYLTKEKSVNSEENLSLSQELTK